MTNTSTSTPPKARKGRGGARPGSGRPVKSGSVSFDKAIKLPLTNEQFGFLTAWARIETEEAQKIDPKAPEITVQDYIRRLIAADIISRTII